MKFNPSTVEDDEAEPHPAMAMSGRRFARQEYQAGLENRSVPQEAVDTHRKRLDLDLYVYGNAYFCERKALETWRQVVKMEMVKIRSIERRYKVFDAWRGTRAGKNYAEIRIELQKLGWKNKAIFFEREPFEKVINGVIVSIYFSSDERVEFKDAPGLDGAMESSFVVHVPSSVFGPRFQHDACDILPTEEGHSLLDGEPIATYSRRLDGLAREFADHVLRDPGTGPCPARDNAKLTQDNDLSL